MSGMSSSTQAGYPAIVNQMPGVAVNTQHPLNPYGLTGITAGNNSKLPPVQVNTQHQLNPYGLTGITTGDNSRLPPVQVNTQHPLNPYGLINPPSVGPLPSQTGVGLPGMARPMMGGITR